MKRTLLNEQKERLIVKISFYLDQHVENIVAAFLFGSFVNEQSFSDIDIGLIMKFQPDQPLHFELSLESQLEKMVAYPVDVRILNKAPLAFSQNVFRTGRVILDKDPNFRADFQGRILKEYFDFAPFQRQYLREVINAPI